MDYLETQGKFLEIEKLKLHFEAEDSEFFHSFLDEKEMEIVAHQINKAEISREVNALIITPENEEVPPGWDVSRIEVLRKKYIRILMAQC